MKNKWLVLRSPDGADSAAAVDPLSEAAGGVNTDFPVLSPDKVLRFKVEKAWKQKNEKTSAESIGLKLKLTDDTENANATFNDGKPCRSGFAVSQYMGITPTEKYDIEAIKRNAALWIKGIWGKTGAQAITFRSFFDHPEQCEGMVLDCRTGINVDKSGAYPPSTKLTPMIPA